MRPDTKALESNRMTGQTIEQYQWLHERHRIFPQVFENRQHKTIIDLSAGIGVVAKNIVNAYPCSLSCNEVDQTCLHELRKLNVTICSFDLDNGQPFPLTDGSFDAVLSLATIEHLIHLNHFVQESYRILNDSGRLYITTPNYASLYWLIPLLRGKSFHDPFGERSSYEFYAHIRYFTYYTLLEFLEHFGFKIDTVYLPLPMGSTHFKTIRDRSQITAFLIQNFFRVLYHISPRWHQEPVLCLAKNNYTGSMKKVIL